MNNSGPVVAAAVPARFAGGVTRDLPSNTCPIPRSSPRRQKNPGRDSDNAGYATHSDYASLRHHQAGIPPASRESCTHRRSAPRPRAGSRVCSCNEDRRSRRNWGLSPSRTAHLHRSHFSLRSKNAGAGNRYGLPGPDQKKRPAYRTAARLRTKAWRSWHRQPCGHSRGGTRKRGNTSHAPPACRSNRSPSTNGSDSRPRSRYARHDRCLRSVESAPRSSASHTNSARTTSSVRPRSKTSKYCSPR